MLKILLWDPSIISHKNTKTKFQLRVLQQHFEHILNFFFWLCYLWLKFILRLLKSVNAQNLVEESVQVKYKAIRASNCRALPQDFERLLKSKISAF